MSLRDVIGQGDSLGVLSGAIRRGRLASSYLFAGEQGIGKKFTAVNLAKAINCQNPVISSGKGAVPPPDSCDACPSCKKIDSGTHPDFTIIEPDGGQIKVEEIRRLEEALSFRAFEGETKVVVVDDAETMNPFAANAFLKTLEEPPAGSLIILVSSSPDRLPLTIRSRCLRVNFRPLSDTDCEKVFKSRGKAPAAPALSMGRPGLAEGLLKDRRKFIAGLGAAEGKHPWTSRKDMERWLDIALIFLRDIAVLRVTRTPDGLLNRDAAAEVEAMGGRAKAEVIMECYQKLQSLRNALYMNPNQGITWNYANSILEELK